MKNSISTRLLQLADQTDVTLDSHYFVASELRQLASKIDDRDAERLHAKAESIAKDLQDLQNSIFDLQQFYKTMESK